MADRATARRNAGPPRGVMHGAPPDGRTEHERILPTEELASFVAHFWSVRWWLAAPFTVETLPHPSVHVVIEWDHAGAARAEVSGVHRGRFTRSLVGQAQVFGVKFRPATFRSLLGAPVASLTDRVLPVGAVFGDGDELARAVVAAPDLAARIAVAEAWLTPRMQPLSAEAASVRDLVERMATDRSIIRADDAAALVGLDLRTLQRRFRDHVGVSPKWVIGRYRLHEAAARLNGPSPPALADLAAELGYFDQAHFARDFKAALGRTPRRFAAPR